MAVRFVWWRIGLVDGGLTLVAVQGHAVVVVVPTAGAAGALEAVPGRTQDPAPIAGGGAINPAPDLEEESLQKANLTHTTAGPVLLPANPSHAHDPALASHGLIRQNASPVQTAVPK